MRGRTPRFARPAAAVDWTRHTDFVARRLTRGRDFHDQSVADLISEADRAAAELGLAVRTSKDRLDPEDALWVQFARAEVAVGEPCPCGSRVLRRRHPQFVECTVCGSLLILLGSREPAGISFDEPDGDEAPEPGAVDLARAPLKSVSPVLNVWGSLTDYGRVRLKLYYRDHEIARYVGTGIDREGMPVFLAVAEPLVDGVEVLDDSSPTGHRHKITLTVPAGIAGAALASEDEEPDITIG